MTEPPRQPLVHRRQYHRSINGSTNTERGEDGRMTLVGCATCGETS